VVTATWKKERTSEDLVVVEITTEMKASIEAIDKGSSEADTGADTGEIGEDTEAVIGVAMTETTMLQRNKTKTMRIQATRQATNQTTARSNQISRKRTTSTKTKIEVMAITTIAITTTTNIPVAIEVDRRQSSKKLLKR
jgi:hypothetical protein